MTSEIDKPLVFDKNENIELPLSDRIKNITRIQHYLLILLYIQWFVFFVTLVVSFYSVLSGNPADVSSGLQLLITVLVLFIYYSFGLLVTYKKYRAGLLIFATIGIILFIALFLMVGYLTLAIVGLTAAFGNINDAYKAIGFMGIAFAVIVIIPIMSLKFTFDLAKLVKTTEYLAE